MASVVPLPTSREEPAPLPSNVEAEAAFIGAVLIKNEIVDQVGATIAPDHFFAPLHARIYERIVKLKAGGATVTPVTLRPYFEGDEGLKEAGGTAYLARLTADGQGLLNPRELAEQICNLATLRSLKLIGRGLDEAAGQADDLDPGALIAEARDHLEALERQTGGDEYAVFLPGELDALPPAPALIEEFLFSDSFAALYAEPKALKSFAALDIGLHIGHGRDWCGKRVQRAGVLYIAGEGARGIRQRLSGWHRHHGIDERLAAFAVLPLAVELLEARNRQRLARAVKRAGAKCGDEVGLIVIDTLSRATPGADENGTETMTAIVQACDDIRQRTGCSILAVHHAGKDKAKGLRGNSALLGALDTVIRADRDGNRLSLTVEHQKDCEEAAPFHFEMATVEWQDPDGKPCNTLVPVPSAGQQGSACTISREQIAAAFDLMEANWRDGRPLSQSPVTKRDGRFAPKIFMEKLGGSLKEWEDLLSGWLGNRCVTVEMADKRSKLKGLKVLERVEP